MLLWSSLFALQEYIIAEIEIKMLELKTLFMLVIILCHWSMAPDFKKTGKVLFKNIFEKVFKL